MSTTEVFALDIGTRKIAGLLMSPTAEGFVIKEASLQHQLPGAMADGQIHHINAVSRVIKNIKTELEEAGDTTLNAVAVAAAGRSLLTETGASTMALGPQQRLSSDEVRALELEAVLSSIQELATHNEGGVMDSYLCVGYSVIQYYLDGEPIGSLIGHQGNQAQVEIIATFLPRIVIDSLGTALNSAGLRMESLTLEPIAAMHVVVPPTMRMLNIALVDVGAGTSDLAISAEGTIKGYGMVSYAGDAITAGIADTFLLDLTVAEKVKVELQPGQTTTCQDVFGNTLNLSYEQILEAIAPRVQTLAEKIAQEIIRLNGVAPKGVILVGGGSLTPELAPLLAKHLDLPQHLVRMRDRTSLEIVKGVPEFSGPEVITPIGIGCTHLDGRAMQLIHVTVNGKQLQFLQMASSQVGDALLHAGLNPTEALGRPGPAFTVELNGRYIPLPGTLGQPATILRNGEPADLTTPLMDGDQIELIPGEAGRSPQVTLAEFAEIPAQSFKISFNGSPLEVISEIKVNGQIQGPEYILQDRDRITLKPITTFQELFEYLQIPLEQEIHFFLNGKSQTVLERVELLINGEQQPPTTPLRSGLEVQYRRKQVTLQDVCQRQPDAAQGITIKVNGQEIDLTAKTATPLANGLEVSLDYIIRPQDRIQYEPRVTGALNSYIVTDIFRDYEPEEAFLQKGGRILVNGVEAGFTTPIKHGDIVEFVAYGADTANS